MVIAVVPGPPPEVPRDALVRVGHEVAWRAETLGMLAVTAQIPSIYGPLLFSYDQGRVEVTGQGWELELTALPEWERDRPP